MKHYVLLKFEKGFYNNQVFEFVKNTFNELKRHIDKIQEVNVFSNCVNRPNNMDIMIVLDLENKDTLYTYLEHELHQFFVQTLDDHVISRVSFDYDGSDKKG